MREQVILVMWQVLTGSSSSMGNDDYKADLDAVNIYYRIKNNRDYVENCK